MTEPRAWYFLSFGSKRQHAGNLGYNDDPERTYRYDSFVANHLNVTAGDLAVIVERDGLLGFGRIEDIEPQSGSKELMRCPIEGCGTTGIKQRTTRMPKFRCHNSHTFDTPLVDRVSCTLYEAHLSQFLRKKNAIPPDALRKACPRYSDQLAIQELDVQKLLAFTSGFQSELFELLSSVNIRYVEAEEADDSDEPTLSYSPSGSDTRPSVMRQIRFRRGQARFRTNLIRRYGPKCQFTGCSVLDVVEAAHIEPYRGDSDNHPENGLLLRGDLHTLFDLDLIGINPQTFTLYLSPLLISSEYKTLAGANLECGKHRPNSEALARRWKSFCLRARATESHPG